MALRRRTHADSVRAWDFDEILIEHYRYAPGPAGAMAPHAHPEYQLSISPDTPGEYAYRRARHAVPVRSISMLHPHEPHAARDIAPRERSAEFWMLYLSPALVKRVADGGAPFFREAVFTDQPLFSRLAALPHQLIQSSSRLSRDIHTESALRILFGHAGLRSAGTSTPVSTRRLERIRERLEDEPGNPSLAELARETDLSTWHFCRAFRARFGEPPHAYLLHARVRRAKRLLAAGRPLTEVALQCGFGDQSHFTRHFRRLTDVTPGRYLRGEPALAPPRPPPA